LLPIGSPFDRLPDEVVFQIVEDLPQKDLLSFSGSCKKWRVKTPEIIAKFAKHYFYSGDIPKFRRLTFSLVYLNALDPAVKFSYLHGFQSQLFYAIYQKAIANRQFICALKMASFKEFWPDKLAAVVQCYFENEITNKSLFFKWLEDVRKHGGSSIQTARFLLPAICTSHIQRDNEIEAIEILQQATGRGLFDNARWEEVRDLAEASFMLRLYYFLGLEKFNLSDKKVLRRFIKNLSINQQKRVNFLDYLDTVFPEKDESFMCLNKILLGCLNKKREKLAGDLVELLLNQRKNYPKLLSSMTDEELLGFASQSSPAVQALFCEKIFSIYYEQKRWMEAQDLAIKLCFWSEFEKIQMMAVLVEEKKTTLALSKEDEAIFDAFLDEDS
jgi:hypothetical protein